MCQLKAVRATKELAGGKLDTRTVLDQVEVNSGFAIDVRGRNLYWAVEKRKRIYAASMDGMARMVGGERGMRQCSG